MFLYIIGTIHFFTIMSAILKARMGIRGHFCMFSSYESTFYCGVASFYGTKISLLVLKLSHFEVWASHKLIWEYEGVKMAKFELLKSIFFNF